jgi:hypothetical protein
VFGFACSGCEYHCILLWPRLIVSDLFVRPWLGRNWFLETVCTLYYRLVPRRAESEWSVLSFDETLRHMSRAVTFFFFPSEMHGRCPNYSLIPI